MEMEGKQNEDKNKISTGLIINREILNNTIFPEEVKN